MTINPFTTFFVLKIVDVPGLVLGRITGVSTPGKPGLVGQYIVAFDADAFSGLGDVKFSPSRAEAKRFATSAEAVAYWRTQSTVRPVREDGQPNRPLTACTVEVERVQGMFGGDA